MALHVSTVHKSDDVRIVHKELASLHMSGVSVSYLAVRNGGVPPSGIRFIELPPPRGRSDRAARLSLYAYRAALAADTGLVHFHDPELIPVGLLLKARGKKVIYDAHESLSKAILSKHYLHPWVRRPVALGAKAAEFVMARFADAIVAATPAIARQFPPEKTVTIQNFPLLSELAVPGGTPYAERAPVAVYTGGITQIRGSSEMIEAVGRVRADVRLSLVGSFDRAETRAKAEATAGWPRVVYHGWQPREALPGLLGEARMGLVLFLPEPNHVEAMPNKLFEYMSAGLPVVASDFPLWRSIVDEIGCGLVADPRDPDAIAAAVDWLLSHPDEAAAMGQRGRRAIEETYNWEREAEKLIALYNRLLA